MAQHDYVIANGTGAAVRSDLNNALAAIVSQNSGATAPSTTYAYQWWADTTTGLLKLRNAANNGWITLFQLDGEWSTLAVENGSAAAPSIYFKDSGTDTGVYSPGTDQVAISTGGTGRLFVDASGNVGVGVSPSAKLEVNGESRFTRPGASSQYVGIIADATDTRIVAEGSSKNLTIKNNSTTSSAILFDQAVASLYVFQQAGTERFRVRADGTFEIKGGGTAGVTPAVSVNPSASENSLVIDSSGRLLVGTSSARSNFYNDTNSAFIQLESASNDGSALALVQNFNANTLGGQLILAKSNAASVGSNTLVASGDACGRVSFQGSDGAQFVEAAQIRCDIDGTPGANDMPGRLVFSTCADGSASPTERMRIDRNGVIDKVVGVYNNTTASAANLFIGAAGDFNRSTSSGKYKTQVEDIEYQYSDALLNCRPVWYRSTCKGDNPNHGWWGFIAEEVAAIDSRLVHWKTLEITYDEKGSAVETSCDPEPEGVAYDRFVPHLLNLIKRQKEQIEAMEARLSALEAS